MSAWADELSLVLGQIKTDEKSNEITAIPELLELIDIKGAVITIDAVKDFFGMDERQLEKYGVVKTEKECSVDHGRIETREYFMCADLSWLDNRRQWAGLKAVVMAKKRRWWAAGSRMT